jgi:hypothetical protein
MFPAEPAVDEQSSWQQRESTRRSWRAYDAYACQMHRPYLMHQAHIGFSEPCMDTTPQVYVLRGCVVERMVNT